MTRRPGRACPLLRKTHDGIVLTIDKQHVPDLPPVNLHPPDLT